MTPRPKCPQCHVECEYHSGSASVGLQASYHCPQCEHYERAPSPQEIAAQRKLDEQGD